MYGLMGKLLRINLSNMKISEENIPESLVKQFIGGRGLADIYFYKEVKPGIKALGPDNKLIFMSGLLTGTPSPSHSSVHCRICC